MTREQFTQHVRKELSGLRRFLLAACSGNSDEADDVAQEALMKAYVASRTLDDEARFSAWLYRIACNTLIDHQRKQTTHGMTIAIDKAQEVAAVSRSDDSFAYQELYCAIDRLNVSERTAVLLFYMEDRPIKHHHERDGRNGERLSFAGPRTFEEKVELLEQRALKMLASVWPSRDKSQRS